MRRAVVVLILAGLPLAAAVFSLCLPYRGFAEDTFVDIPKGTSSRGVARLLSQSGVIASRWQFLAVRALRPRTKLQAGEYRFVEPDSPWRVFNRLVRGDVFYYEVTVPEGQNLFDIAGSLDRIGVIRGEEFIAAARDTAPIRDLAPEATSLEGFLFPDTYRITRRATAGELCGLMTGRFREAWAQLGAPQRANAIVTLASLVEKETARDEERPVVASVYRNRLVLGMPLSCDPTTIYAALLEGRFRGEISRADLESKNPYNTYQHAGLPPGPIANPGFASLKAALHPADTGYLYFVARPDGSGAHVFSKDLDAHQRAVSKYRRGNHKADQARASEPTSRRNPARAYYRK